MQLPEFIQIIRKLEEENHPVLIAIDGRCASGKTTFASVLAGKLGASIVHMDDFFLRPQQRTAERYNEPGGNVDRERVIPVLKELSEGKSTSYFPFDCSKMKLASQAKEVPCTNAVIVEGSYSMHPDLSKYYSLRIFMDVNPEEQLERIRIRNGEEKLKVFRSKWIPLEEKYFRALGIQEKADVMINTSRKEEEKEGEQYGCICWTDSKARIRIDAPSEKRQGERHH